MAKVREDALWLKELWQLDSTVFELQRAIRASAWAGRALRRLGQWEGVPHAAGAVAEAERALAVAKAARAVRRRLLRRHGYRFCKCGTALSKDPCRACGGKRSKRCGWCHGTGRDGVRATSRLEAK